MEQQSISSDLIRGHIDTIILYSLIDGDKYAQQISDAIEEKSKGDYKMNQATLYSSLKRLENLKFVSSYWYDSDENNGRRKFFKITDLGKDTVKSNLNNWSFSRALIDKLVDCTPTPIYQTQVVERIVEVPVQTSPVPVLTQIQNSSSSNNIEEKPVTVTETENANQERVTATVEQKPIISEGVKPTEQTVQEINFRNILSGLIKSSQPKKPEPVTELTPVVKSPETKPEKLNFNETITTVDYNEHKAQNNGKIDFGDLVIKATQEGYKIRISSKDSGVSDGKLLINKLNLCSALLVYLVFLVEFLVLSLTGYDILGINTLGVVLTLVIASIFPIIYSVLFFRKPAKRTNKLIYADSILTVTIIVFNLLLITFAGNLIFSVDFTNTFSLLSYFVLPAIIYLDVLVYYVVKYFIAKSKLFITKSK